MKQPSRVFLLWLSCLLLFDRCAYNDLNELQQPNPPADCTASGLTLSVVTTQNVTSCKAVDGKIVVTAVGGTAPYDFNLNGGVYQTGSEFSNLAPGTYTIVVKDVNGCSKSLEVIINAVNSTLNATYTAVPDSQCFSDNGSITITATGGNGPYTYQLDSKGFVTANTFAGLASGQHAVIIKDASDCQKVLSIQIPRGLTGTSYANQIKPILIDNCAFSGCHGTNSSNGDWTNFTKVKEKASLIKMRTGNKSMPIGGGALTQQQIDLIACWVDDGALNN